MPPVRITSSSDGPRITVNTMIQEPRLIPTRILNVLDQQFVADQLLRSAGGAPGGAVRYFESAPLFAENDPEIVPEFGEIPVAHVEVGEPILKPTVKRALAVVISEEMRRRNNTGEVNRQIRVVRNTIVRATDGPFIQEVIDAVDGSHVIPATVAWDGDPDLTRIRYDISLAKQSIVDERRGFMPDTLLIGPTLATILEGADEINRVYQGDIAGQRPELQGGIPRRISGLDVVVSYSVDELSPGSAFVLERNTIGGIADERPLQATELYLWKREAETWRSDTLRQSVGFIDEPLAIAEISGTNSLS